MRKELVVFLFGVALCAQGARLSEMHDARPCEGESPLVTNSVDATLLSLQLAQMREVDCSRLYVKARAFAETNRVHCVSDGKPSIALMRDWRRLSEESQSNVVRQVSSSLQGKGLTDPQIFEAGQRVLKKLTRRMFVEIAEVDGEPAVRGVADVVSDDLSYCLLFDRAGRIDFVLRRMRMPSGRAILDSLYVYDGEGQIAIVAVDAQNANVFCCRDGKWAVCADEERKKWLFQKARAAAQALMECN